MVELDLLKTEIGARFTLQFVRRQDQSSVILIPDLLGISGSTSPLLRQYKPATASSVLKGISLAEMLGEGGAQSKFFST